MVKETQEILSSNLPDDLSDSFSVDTVENETPLSIAVCGEEDLRDPNARSAGSAFALFEEQSFLHWSLWVASFGVCNIFLYHLFSLIFVGDVSAELIDARTAVYAIILGLLSAVASLAYLSALFAKDLKEMPLGLKGVTGVITGYATLAALIHVFSGQHTFASSALTQQAIWVVFFVSWWAFLRRAFLELAVARTGFVEFESGVSARNSASSEDEVIVPEGAVVRQTLEVVKGLSLALERQVGGEGHPVARQMGDILPAGSKILRGRVLGRPIERAADKSIHWFVQRLHAVLGELKPAVQRAQLVFNVLLLGLTVVVCGLAISGLAVGETLPPILQSVTMGQLIAALAAGMVLEVVVFRSLLGPLALTKLFFEGVVFSSATVLEKLVGVRSVSFRIASREDLAGCAEVSSIDMLDQRVDKERLFAVVFGLLRNAQDPVSQAVREYCFEEVKQLELFSIDEDGQTNSGLFFGRIQGAPFLVGSESALVEQGVQLELSDTLMKDATEEEIQVFVALGQEPVARFSVRPPASAEMPVVISTLREKGINAKLASQNIEQDELDQIGRDAGFELPQIRSEVQKSSLIPGAIQRRSYSDLEVLFQPSEAAQVLHDTQSLEHAPLVLTWFRPALWNVAHEGVLLTEKRQKTIPQIFLSSHKLASFRGLLSTGTFLGGGVLVVVGFSGVVSLAAVVGIATLLSLTALGLVVQIGSYSK